MSRRSDGQGATLADALRGALAELIDAPAEDLVMKVDGPGIDEVTGRVRLDLDITADRATEPTPRKNDQGSPAAPTAQDGAGDRTRDDVDATDRDEVVVTAEDLDAEADAAADFLEGLLDALDLPGDIRIRTAEDHAEVEVVDIGSGALIGRRGQTLEAIQELVRCALQREFQRRSRVKVDAEGYRARRLEKLIEKAEEAVDEVLATGESVRLEPMDVFERKAIHSLVADVEGVVSRSQGREPARRVVFEVE